MQPTSIKIDQYGNAIPTLTAFAQPNELLHVLPELSFPMKELKKTLKMWKKAGIPEIFMNFKENDKKEVC
ncbi:hypothetical protein L1D19_20700 [Vibrio natriegens]|uniref:hypothetical protein n=1 Tax=Vibrio natriegens TaxID=691 RepID=UPI001EFD8225|nr:hypothetical protein [Vibrio natriegens]MCG9702492.1 hypothetical protein [Vibrio natriegens]